MKLNLGCGTDIREGYVNIDLDPKDPLVKRGNFKNLDALGIQDGLVEEVIATNVIQFLPPNELMPALKHWAGKLAAGGTLWIQSVDYNLLGNQMSYDQVSPEDINKLLFGESEKPNRAIYNLVAVEALLKSEKLVTVEKGYLGTSFFIRVRKE